MAYLGIDTSNYPTSAALWLRSGELLQQKKLLPVREGALGLRQSDAVFAHVKQLGALLEPLLRDCPEPVAAVGVSTRPRDVEGSYMPCFLVGELAAQAAAAACRAPLHRFSHQAGHLAAALYSAGRLDLVGRRFGAFHFSGGTSECLLVGPDEALPFGVELVGRSLDLKAGQAVDRVGRMLGLPFPAGKYLDELAGRSQRQFRVRPVLRGLDCSLSGVENRCRQMLDRGEPACDIARLCMESILAAADGMTARFREAYGPLPIVYAGGVMCNSLLRRELARRHRDCYFADPAFSADNAAGIAVLARLAEEGAGC